MTDDLVRFQFKSLIVKVISEQLKTSVIVHYQVTIAVMV